MSRPVQPNTTLTIVAACLATAMLMLDISVINTALSDIASGLDTGLSGLQWLVDAYTIPLAATVLTAGAIADRFGRRRLFIIGLAIFTVSSALCGAAGGIEVLVGSRAIQGLGASMMFATALALISQVTPDRESTDQGAGRLRRRDRRLVRARPVHRRRPDRAVRLAGDLPRQRADRRRRPLDHLPVGRRGPRPDAAADRRARAADPDRRALPARAGAAARQRGGLGQRRHRRGARRCGDLPDRLRRRSRSARASRCCRCACWASALRRRPGGGVRDRGVVLRRLPLPHALSADGARHVADRDRARLPAGDLPRLRRLRDDGAAGRELLAGEDREHRARARRRRPRADAVRGRRLLLDRPAARACS